MGNSEEEKLWSDRYVNQSTGWDIGEVSRPLKEYIDQLDNKDASILIPGAGNGYEAEYLHRQGFRKVYVLDISRHPLNNIQQRVPDFPSDHLIHHNFFEYEGRHDLIIEQTFFCSFPPLPTTRQQYAQKMYDLLNTEGTLAGLWFDFPLTEDLVKRPFGGSKEEYLDYFTPLFEVEILERCYNSIQPRSGKELFGVFRKK